MRISDWSSDVCSSDLGIRLLQQRQPERRPPALEPEDRTPHRRQGQQAVSRSHRHAHVQRLRRTGRVDVRGTGPEEVVLSSRSEEHTSELQSLMRNSYAAFCLKKKNTIPI